MKKILCVSLFVLILQFAAFAQFDLGMKSAKAGDFQTALQHFQNSRNENLSAKKQAQIHYNIGVCFYQLKQPDKAVTEFEKAVRLYPNYEKAFYALAMANTDLKNFVEAETAFRQSLKLSNNAETWFDLAAVLFELKKYDESAEGFQNAIRFGSGGSGASHNNLGVIYALKGDFLKAESELKIAEKLKFEDAEINLEIVRKAMTLNDKSLIAKLNFKGEKL